MEYLPQELILYQAVLATDRIFMWTKKEMR